MNEALQKQKEKFEKKKLKAIDQVKAQHDEEVVALKAKNRRKLEESEKRTSKLRAECLAKDAAIDYLQNKKRKAGGGSNMPATKKTKTKHIPSPDMPSTLTVGSATFLNIGTQNVGPTIEINGDRYVNMNDKNLTQYPPKDVVKFSNKVLHHENDNVRREKHWKISSDRNINQLLPNNGRWVWVVQGYSSSSDSLPNDDACFTTKFGGFLVNLRPVWMKGYNLEGFFGHSVFSFRGDGLKNKGEDERDGFIPLFDYEAWGSDQIPLNAILTSGREVKPNSVISLQEQWFSWRDAMCAGDGEVIPASEEVSRYLCDERKEKLSKAMQFNVGVNEEWRSKMRSKMSESAAAREECRRQM